MSAPLRIEAHAAEVGGIPIRRALPTARRRLIGPWCFLDHIGPSVLSGPGLRVPPHPHIGLQTFTWMMDGELFHRDSLGSEQLIRPGQVNLMTAGRGIAHSEESPAGHNGRLHGAQLWIALPESERHCAPAFQHVPELPRFGVGDARGTLLAGTHVDLRAPVDTRSPLVALDVVLPAGSAVALALDAGFEHGLLATQGQVRAGAETLDPGTLLYFPPGATTLALAAIVDSRVLLVGGPPFGEDVLLWWNFVARQRPEIIQATEDWNAGRGNFGIVRGFPGAPLVAPATPWTVPPNPAS